VDDADRLMADRQTSHHRVLAFENLDIGAADRGRRDLDQRVERADIRGRLSSRTMRPGSTKTAAFIIAIALLL
jgi:hypothetical protein